MTRRKYLLLGLVTAVSATLSLLTVQQADNSNISYVSYWMQKNSLQASIRKTRIRSNDEHPRTAMKQEEGSSTNCSPRNKFVFIRTHKTGSSTTINIFQRYAIHHKLKVLMPVGQGTLSWPFPPREEDYTHTPDEQYDALMHHFVYNKTWLVTKFPPETLYISIIREPFGNLKSQMHYYHLPHLVGLRHSGNPVKKFLQNPWQFKNRSQAFFPHVNVTWDGTRNPQMFDLGWPAEKADDEEEARRYIKQLDADFTLVMVLEHLDESVVLLRRLLCWEIRDVLYYTVNKNQRAYPYKRYVATPEELDNHCRWSALDYMLYDAFNRSLWRKIDAQGPDFFDELQYFQSIKVNVSRHCNRTTTEHKNETLVIPASKWSPEFEVDYKYCSYIMVHRAFVLDVVMRGRRYTRQELSYSVIDQTLNFRLLRRGLPSFRNRHDVRAAGISHLRPMKIYKNDAVMS